ncbi:MAG: phosphoribosylaminoimidazolesuccinocarboxamide synthase [Alphaproteobacteria bacterium]|jgi:phosphoribosylaminoimidazole-succinocarboxamide synthase|nr:phosphoribosylaminoimidazolesuccinocarboxamide synthase [Alphaproteobacteria bacterium]MBT4019939.1 phosphoribosylaminoimidazolesuccinocarboxamide synthase [Alphaproteobacteria bacterium]MBT4964769.1 phosphoribosylaminoimidazolesuccinocarboxamide synthase [Alphaproteobacteria bacterium]MBT5158457.1 phosphoribosylaminoimidazolesuccinocarboxamide synthase [Alphaproteobacteria bacterium]MBT5919224.1 phosphoribosylaminoimidazolesuccinocarboxamide synthase [Alphaproteobacteria bacterium]
MSRRRQIYEGKAKILFEGPEPGTVVQYFKDDASTAGATIEDADRTGTIIGKGVLNNRISEYLMTQIGDMGVPTHFIRRLNMREQLCREVDIIPLVVVVRNYAAGSFANRLGIVEGTRLPRTIVEFHYKSNELKDPLVTEEHIACFGWSSPSEIDEIISMSLRTNDYLSGLFMGIGIRLVDFKLEFGRFFMNDEIRTLLADEISPDNCRLWDVETNDKMDKDRFRRNMGGEAEAYQEVARRLGITPESGPRDLPGPTLIQ